uniref:Uncharacterized protein n=1 Tax=viral metagenome TaxID=1070528 RepID=A0A6C0HIU8_9ZZZZ
MKSYVMATIRIPLEIVDTNYEILNDRIDIQFEPCPILPEIQESNKDLLQSLFSASNLPKENEEEEEKVLEEEEPVLEEEDVRYNLKKNRESVKKRQHISFKKYRPRINYTQKKYI